MQENLDVIGITLLFVAVFFTLLAFPARELRVRTYYLGVGFVAVAGAMCSFGVVAIDGNLLNKWFLLVMIGLIVAAHSFWRIGVVKASN